VANGGLMGRCRHLPYDVHHMLARLGGGSLPPPKSPSLQLSSWTPRSLNWFLKYPRPLNPWKPAWDWTPEFGRLCGKTKQFECCLSRFLSGGETYRLHSHSFQKLFLPGQGECCGHRFFPDADGGGPARSSQPRLSERRSILHHTQEGIDSQKPVSDHSRGVLEYAKGLKVAIPSILKPTSAHPRGEDVHILRNA